MALPARASGRLVVRGLHDELKGTAYWIVEGIDGRTHHLRLLGPGNDRRRQRARSSRPGPMRDASGPQTPVVAHAPLTYDRGAGGRAGRHLDRPAAPLSRAHDQQRRVRPPRSSRQWTVVSITSSRKVWCAGKGQPGPIFARDLRQHPAAARTGRRGRQTVSRNGPPHCPIGRRRTRRRRLSSAHHPRVGTLSP